jgi:Zn-dependent protease with chaperone function
MSYAIAKADESLSQRPPLPAERGVTLTTVESQDGSPAASNRFPELTRGGAKVNAKTFVAKGTTGTVSGAFVIAILATLVGIVFSYGILLVVLLAYPFIAWYLHKKARALLHGSGIRVSETQFPQIHACVNDFVHRLDINKEVDVYIVEANVVNAAAVRYGKKNVVVLTDDLIHGCVSSGHPEALAFVIGHELAHIALNHNSPVRAWLARHMKKLGRLDEYSADAVASALVHEKEAAFHGLLLLTVGHALLRYVDRESVLRQAQEVAEDSYSTKAERTLSHPLLLNRLNRVLQAA